MPCFTKAFLNHFPQCLERGWYDCYNGLQEIWAKTDTSKPNSTVSRCIASARRYQNTSAAASTLASANDTTVGTDSCPQLDSAKKVQTSRFFLNFFLILSFFFWFFFFYLSDGGTAKILRSIHKDQVCMDDVHKIATECPVHVCHLRCLYRCSHTGKAERRPTRVERRSGKMRKSKK